MITDYFIHLFKVANKYYFYDVNKNSILNIDYKLYDYLLKVKENKIENIDTETSLKLDDLLSRGYLSNKRIEEIEHPMSRLISSYLTSKLQSICLQVTQDCNLRCKYCAYSGSYNNRIHSKKTMSVETAKKAVDFLIHNSSESDVVGISFYGGEPLLEFDLIKEVVLYTLNEYPGKMYYFTLTTNGTVFNEEILEFMNHYKFGITISLDGDREIHNLNRKFKNSDRGSFDVIMRNIEIIKEKYDHLYSNLSFSVVLSVAADYIGCGEFFANTSILNNADMVVSAVSNRYKDDNLNEQKEKNIIAERYEIFKCILACINKIELEDCSPMIKNYYFEIKNLYNRFYESEESVPTVAHPSGPCLPGAFRLFISADGDFLPCEKVSEKSIVARIGNLEDGFNHNNIYNVMNVGKIGDMCKDCWAYRYCKICVAAIDDLDELSIKKKEECCKRVKQEVEMMMKEYCFINEYSNSFD